MKKNLDVLSTPQMPPHAAKVLLPSRGITVKNHQTSNFNLIKVREWKLKISYNTLFCKIFGHLAFINAIMEMFLPSGGQ
jgi:hypothetical protein